MPLSVSKCVHILRLSCAYYWAQIGIAGTSSGLEHSYGAYSLGVGTASLGARRKCRSLILSLVGCFPWGARDEKLAPQSVVWRIGGALLEVPRLPSCVGAQVAPQGMELGLVFNDSLRIF